MKLNYIIDKMLVASFFLLYPCYEIWRMYPKNPIFIFPSFLCVLLFVVMALFSAFKRLPWDDSFFRLFFVFEGVVYCLMFGNSLFNEINVGPLYVTYLYPLLAYVFMYNIVLSSKNVNFIPYLVGIIAVLFIVILYTNENRRLLESALHTDNASYTVLYLLPFVLAMKKNGIKFIGVISVVVAVTLSFKRGGLICVFLGIYAYLFVACINANNLSTRVKRIVFMLSSVILAGLFLIIVNDFMDDYLFFRFSMIEKGGGSDRDIIWLNTLEMISNSSIWSLLVGHGYDAVLHDATFFSNLKYSAHNDFLECIYDFGAFSFFAYCGLYIVLVKKCIEMAKLKSFYAAPLAATIPMLLMNSLVSHIFFYEWHFMSFALFWGYASAAHKRELFKKQPVWMDRINYTWRNYD